MARIAVSGDAFCAGPNLGADHLAGNDQLDRRFCCLALGRLVIGDPDRFCPSRPT